MLHQDKTVLPESYNKLGCKVTYNNYYSGTSPFQLFDKIVSAEDRGNGWGSSSGLSESWVQIEFPNPTKVDAYALYTRTLGFYKGEFPAGCTISASNDGVIYDILHTVEFTEERLAGDSVVCKFKNTKPYTRYKFTFPKSQGCQFFVFLQEIDLLFFDSLYTIIINNRHYIIKNISGVNTPVELLNITVESINENGMVLEDIFSNLNDFSNIMSDNKFKISKLKGGIK